MSYRRTAPRRNNSNNSTRKKQTNSQQNSNHTRTTTSVKKKKKSRVSHRSNHNRRTTQQGSQTYNIHDKTFFPFSNYGFIPRLETDLPVNPYYQTCFNCYQKGHLAHHCPFQYYLSPYYGSVPQFNEAPTSFREHKENTKRQNQNQTKNQKKNENLKITEDESATIPIRVFCANCGMLGHRMEFCQAPSFSQLLLLTPSHQQKSIYSPKNLNLKHKTNKQLSRNNYHKNQMKNEIKSKREQKDPKTIVQKKDGKEKEREKDQKKESENDNKKENEQENKKEKENENQKEKEKEKGKEREKEKEKELEKEKNNEKETKQKKKTEQKIHSNENLKKEDNKGEITYQPWVPWHQQKLFKDWRNKQEMSEDYYFTNFEQKNQNRNFRNGRTDQCNNYFERSRPRSHSNNFRMRRNKHPFDNYNNGGYDSGFFRRSRSENRDNRNKFNRNNYYQDYYYDYNREPTPLQTFNNQQAYMLNQQEFHRLSQPKSNPKYSTQLQSKHTTHFARNNNNNNNNRKKNNNKNRRKKINNNRNNNHFKRNQSTFKNFPSRNNFINNEYDRSQPLSNNNKKDNNITNNSNSSSSNNNNNDFNNKPKKKRRRRRRKRTRRKKKKLGPKSDDQDTSGSFSTRGRSQKKQRNDEITRARSQSPTHDESDESEKSQKMIIYDSEFKYARKKNLKSPTKEMESKQVKKQPVTKSQNIKQQSNLDNILTTNNHSENNNDQNNNNNRLISKKIQNKYSLEQNINISESEHAGNKQILKKNILSNEQAEFYNL
ncbi:chascon isoform d-related [Anaeramoeba flamelloides]|uniref:Chascon isoform d-related n=1 Tax=Anaeramoeba flamelloides TaxID=1746091 RepID=A0AAV7ZS60_9EUKA|nr:chascon isoform d-related [Anaeramoeba flamelloides]